MNTKLFSVISGIILISATGLAIAKSIHLSNTQMDTVTAGTEGESFSQSSSSSQISIQDDGTVYYSMSASAQGDSATASAEVQILEPGTLIPFTAFIEAP
ncbi:hypothetical protein CRENPOLYSF2_1610004 [Crenothrix polyspora]|uniref:Uncharacterized protein n=1 Tax=Crenothrix polyspora TaxID=360316 RepID=A0A1R4H2V0_9GAMM|nr:hypothetical protein [Crenothrix polyspora]SJM90380.1 hypothetical protein CRENPOLYSF2_1610004 [Crenothrix polyspora]